MSPRPNLHNPFYWFPNLSVDLQCMVPPSLQVAELTGFYHQGLYPLQPLFLVLLLRNNTSRSYILLIPSTYSYKWTQQSNTRILYSSVQANAITTVCLWLQNCDLKIDRIELPLQCFENIPWVSEEKSKSLPDLLGVTEGAGDPEAGQLGPPAITPLWVGTGDPIICMLQDEENQVGKRLNL